MLLYVGSSFDFGVMCVLFFSVTVLFPCLSLAQIIC